MNTKIIFFQISAYGSFTTEIIIPFNTVSESHRYINERLYVESLQELDSIPNCNFTSYHVMTARYVISDAADLYPKSVRSLYENILESIDQCSRNQLICLLPLKVLKGKFSNILQLHVLTCFLLVLFSIIKIVTIFYINK